MRLALTAAVSLLLLACGRNGSPNPPGTQQTNPDQLTAAQRWDESQGFVVHEWGTLTSVHASDGSLLPGLHHEEEDLPPFVADRMVQAKSTPGVVVVDQKMETPVTYFYSAQPQTVSARVDFPNGILTQWFPLVQDMNPPLFSKNGEPVDPWLSLSLTCSPSFDGPFNGGSLDWGSFKILARGESPQLPGPVDDTTWGFSRNVASNVLAFGNQHERFLFYRGLGNFSLPVTVEVKGSSAAFSNPLGQSVVPAVFLIQVTKDAAGFSELGAVPGGAVAKREIPAPTMALGEFVQALKSRLKAVLEADGLYADEAQAMVDTWERSYFLTPGIRALYLLPQAVTDKVLPLTIAPAPKVMKRSMVIRLELLTPGYEAQLGQWLTELAQPATELLGRGRFYALGRFAEPHLTRAVRITSSAAEKSAGEALLLQIRQQRRWAPTAAE